MPNTPNTKTQAHITSCYTGPEYGYLSFHMATDNPEVATRMAGLRTGRAMTLAELIELLRELRVAE